jgi:hypothetical protein
VQAQTQLPVGQQRRRIVAPRRQHLHQGALRLLPQRIDGYRQSEVALRRRRLTARQGQRRQPLQGSEISPLADLPLLEGPFLRAPFQQRPPVKGDRLFQRFGLTPSEGSVEGEHVHRRAGQLQRESAGRGRAQPAGCGAKGPAEVGQAIAEAVQRRGRGGLRPEHPGQPLPLHPTPGPLPRGKRGAAQREQSEDRLAFAEAEVGEGWTAQAHFERPEQPHAEWRHCLV